MVTMRHDVERLRFVEAREEFPGAMTFNRQGLRDLRAAIHRDKCLRGRSLGGQRSISS